MLFSNAPNILRCLLLFTFLCQDHIAMEEVAPPQGREASCSLGAAWLCQLPSAVTHRESDARRGVAKLAAERRGQGRYSPWRDSDPLRVSCAPRTLMTSCPSALMANVGV